MSRITKTVMINPAKKKTGFHNFLPKKQTTKPTTMNTEKVTHLFS